MAANAEGVGCAVRWRFRTQDEVFAVAISPEGDLVAAGSDDDNLYVLNQHGGLLWKAEMGADVMGAGVVRGGEMILAGSEDNSVLCFFDRSGRRLDAWNLDGEFGLRSLDATDEGEYIAVGGAPGGVRLLDVRSRREIWRFEGQPNIWHVALSANAARIAAASRDNRALLLDRNGQLVWSYQGSMDFVGAAISEDGRTVVVGDWNATVWCFGDSGLQWRYRSGGKWFKGLAMTPRAEYIAAAAETGPGSQGSVYLLDEGGRLLWEHLVDQNAQDVDITPDGRFVAVGTQTGEVILLENLLPATGGAAVKNGRFGGSIARTHVVRRQKSGILG